MINNFKVIVSVAAATLPFIFLCMRSKKINLERKYRSHQFILPIIAVLYCAISMIAITKIEIGVAKFIGFLTNYVGLIPIIGGILHKIFDFLNNLFHMGYGVQLMCNTALMAGFCIVKRLALPAIKRWWSNWRALYDNTSAVFYAELGDRSILLEQYANLRTFFNVMYYTLIAVGALDCIISFMFSTSNVFRFPFYPVFGIIVLGEICFFLDGETFDEISGSSGPGADGHSVECEKLMEELERLFGERVNIAEQIPKPFTGKKPHDWELELAAGDYMDQVTGAYFGAMTKAGEKINPDYVNATNRLMHHKSVLVHNPFYHDMTDYLLLPIFHELLNHHTVLIVCGRMSNEDDIKKWIYEGIENVTNLPKLWKIDELSEYTSGTNVPDIGILGFKRLYDLDTLNINKDFFKKTTLVILLEPSNLLGTGQIGLRSILQYCEEPHKSLTYCALDRNADGLVDALSHAVRQSITEVIASPVPETGYCRMFWKAEGPGLQNRILPRISHYLGIGTELGAVAMHEGVDHIYWYSGSKMPLVDLKWNTEQYYSSICQYIHSPREQSELDVRFMFFNGLWQAKNMSEAFVLVEDEFCNVFEMARTFSARIQKKGFINILSENYLLRDYMCANNELFSNDPKAIPSIVPDYARTERNLVLRIMMLMAVAPVDERTLSTELSLHGCETKYPYNKICELISKYTDVEDIQIQTVREKVTSGGQVHSRFSYKADRIFVESIFDSALKSAHYVIENEQLDKYPMGNRLLGHVEQVLLPGQFFSFDGKYYQVRSISKENGIVVRRSGDHIVNRKYYRQLRDYKVYIMDYVDDKRNLRNINIQTCHADVDVATSGYLELKSANLLKSATIVKLDKIRTRHVKYKDTLRVQLDASTPEIRFTICLLLNELFQSIFPSEVGYIVAAMPNVPDCVSGDDRYSDRIRALVPSLETSVLEDDAIYLIEDSNIDLGIIVSIERNFQRLLEIITDYLDWYLDPDRDRQGENAVDEEPENDGAEPGSGDIDRDLANHLISKSKEATSDVDGEDEQTIDDVALDAINFEYVEYLTFGYDDVAQWLKLQETLKYLVSHNFDDSNLHHSRKKNAEFDEGSDYDPSQPGTHYCDFCGRVLEKGNYVILKDGRERCPVCSQDAIKTKKQFKKIYEETLEEMESIFGITIDCKIKVRMTNARKVNDIPGEKWKPGPGMDARVLGYAQKSTDGNKLLVENGAPKWKMKSTLVHELTHIWQFENWNDNQILKEFPTPEQRNLNMEGMAVWTEIQYLIAMGEKERAIRYKRNRDADPSVYGVGMKKFLAKYPIKEVSSMKDKPTPFKKFPPLK